MKISPQSLKQKLLEGNIKEEVRSYGRYALQSRRVTIWYFREEEAGRERTW